MSRDRLRRDVDGIRISEVSRSRVRGVRSRTFTVTRFQSGFSWTITKESCSNRCTTPYNVVEEEL